MKLKFKSQQFQTDAVNSIINCFAGQPKATSHFNIDIGNIKNEELNKLVIESFETEDVTIGFKNKVIELTEDQVFANIISIQQRNGIKVSEKLEGKYNLTIEMETGTGKTYTYIKTMFELNKVYGWSKFIIIVPSIAIREGVYKSLQITEDHFMAEYGKKARYFIYNSKQLHNIESFASDSGINVMIINSQAFAARGKDARRIYMELDEFQSRRPIDVIAETNPILIVDEPQSVEGMKTSTKTKEALQEFNSLFVLRYSATHPYEYNKVYRLDTLDAYNKMLVKKINVKGISLKGSTGTEGYIYLEGIDLSKKQAPVARIEYEEKTKKGIRKVRRSFHVNDDLYHISHNLEQYKGYKIAEINGYNNTITFVNGVTLEAGDALGDVDELNFRRIQIRETIKSHLEKERILFDKEIKVLSLFFIDEVAKYRQYDKTGTELNGEYAKVFEEEYQEAVNYYLSIFDDPYTKYLKRIEVKDTHKGYFSIDRKSKKFINPKAKGKEVESDDVDAYDLIMKDKEQLLSFSEPTRFIFSHSALREGWDNPNVFQICTLKHSDSMIKKRQEVGRGLRLCVNQNGERIDNSIPGIDVHDINVLTIIASESYDTFAKELQSEIAEALSERQDKSDIDLLPFAGDERKQKIKDFRVNWQKINQKIAYTVHFDSEELIQKCVISLDQHLRVPDVLYSIQQGELGQIQSKEQLIQGDAFKVYETQSGILSRVSTSQIRYDLIGKLIAETHLTRKTIVSILAKIKPLTLQQFKKNPEEFILRASKLINEEKATTIIKKIKFS